MIDEFDDNDDDHLPENSKSSSYLEKRLASNLNANDTLVDEDENALDSPITKKRGKNKVYEILKKFPQEIDLVTATSEMNELGWIKGKVKELKNGTKCLFRCKRGCPKSKYIEFG